jgi:transketolase
MATATTATSLDQLAVNTIRALSIDAVQQANSGHPGLPLGAAPMAYVLWTRFLRHNPRNPHWPDRDRFVFSAGHGSMLLYSLLHLTGYDLPLDEIKRFRQWGSKTPGHPEARLTPGVELTTGPLGQGFANGVGLALAEAHLAATYNREGVPPIVDHRTFGIVSDGDLMEGVSYEAASLAGHLGLGKLVYLYDDNRVTLAGSTGLVFSEDVGRRFEAARWHVQRVEDGNDLEAIERAIRAGVEETQRPSLIMVHTTLAFGSPHKAGTFQAHGNPLGAEEVVATKHNLGWSFDEPFFIPQDALAHFRSAVERGQQLEQEWQTRLEAYARAQPELAQQFRRTHEGELPAGWDRDLPTFEADPKGIATRAAGGKVINAVAAVLPELVGGSADLNPSTDTALKGQGDFENPANQAPDRQGSAGGAWGYAGRNLFYGVREHAMGAITNGLAYHGGLRPFSATFLVFSDYMRPPMRLAALSELPSVFVFTHDSIGLGEDGPTHQPIEHLAGLRAIPNMVVFRPADANEVTEGWRVAIERRHAPTTLVFSRQALPIFDRSRVAPAAEARKGAYVLAREEGSGGPDVILIASGSEVALCMQARELLARDSAVRVRVVSMPSFELFAAQPREYRDEVLPPSVRARLAVEAAAPLGWERWVGLEGDVVGLRRFGASAPYTDVFKHLDFTPEYVAERARALLRGDSRGDGSAGAPPSSFSAERASFSKSEAS